jgi:hypothetical protein
LSWAKRGLLWVASLLLLIPSWSGVWLMIDAVGVVLGLILVLWEWNRSAARAPVAQANISGP